MSESLVRSLIRLLVTVGVLAAVYFFIVSPVLDTTNDTIDRAFDASSGFQESINESFETSGLDPVNIQGQTSATQAEKVLRCVQRVQPDTVKMQKCTERFR